MTDGYIVIPAPRRRYNKSYACLAALPILQTPRLTLRPMTVADTDAVYQDDRRFPRLVRPLVRLGAAPARRDSVQEYIQQAEEAMTVGTRLALRRSDPAGEPGRPRRADAD